MLRHLKAFYCQYYRFSASIIPHYLLLSANSAATTVIAAAPGRAAMPTEVIGTSEHLQSSEDSLNSRASDQFATASAVRQVGLRSYSATPSCRTMPAGS